MNEQKPPSREGMQVLWGFLTGMGIVVPGGIIAVTSSSMFTAELTLVAYVIAVFVAFRKDKSAFAKGLLLVLGLGVLLASACFGIALYSLR